MAEVKKRKPRTKKKPGAVAPTKNGRPRAAIKSKSSAAADLMAELRPSLGRKKFTEAKQLFFIGRLLEGSSISQGARDCGISVTSLYKFFEADPAFRELVDDVVKGKMHDLENAAYNRALKGVEKDVYFKGELIGSETHFPEGLTMFFLKAHFPEKYGDKQSIEMSGELGQGTLSDEDLMHELKRIVGKND